MGLAPGADPAEFLAGLNARLGLATGLAAMGVRREDLPAIADAALLDHCHATNPRVATRDDYLMMLETSFEG
jgi:alcohol dehydrogenase class IV